MTATAGHGQVTLSWDNPDNATISKWQYQQKQGDGSYGPWMDIPGSTASTTSYTVTGLTNGDGLQLQDSGGERRWQRRPIR